jgi:hypothetical protein
MLDFANNVVARPMVIMGAMRQIEAKDIGAGTKQRVDLFVRRARGTKCRDDFGFTLSTHADGGP